MQQKTGICSQCNKPKPINSKGVCSQCVYLNNHGGKSQQEVYSERSNKKQIGKPKQIYNLKRLPLKTSKKRVNGKLKNERLEKRREQIRLDELTYEEVFNSRPNHCEECYLLGIDTPLPEEFRNEEGFVNGKSQYSHIMTKAAFPEFRNDKRNFNRLCLDHHNKWEFGDREEMEIYPINQITIQELLNEKNNGK